MLKKLLVVFCFICLSLPAIGGQNQQNYEKTNAIKILVTDQYKNLLFLYNNRDEADAPAIEAIKKNFDTCKTLSCWQYVDVDDYTYKYISDDVKKMVLYNNAIYKLK